VTGRRRRSERQIWVVKLGGSLAGGALLADWLDVLAAGGGRVVVVPGGGPFADAVREAQQRSKFDDAVAHRMALLAMEQYGLMLAGLRPGLHPADSNARILKLLDEGATPVWMPSRMVLGDADIPESWDVTSDSLAAWLAGELAADCLILVKSVAVEEGRTVGDLVRLGIVDPALPEFLARSRSACHCIEAGRYRDMAAALASGLSPGTRIVGPAADSGKGGGSIAGERRRANIVR
jgi:5-(aminomethyl)-3-furanmethanol phosphate kinase